MRKVCIQRTSMGIVVDLILVCVTIDTDCVCD